MRFSLTDEQEQMQQVARDFFSSTDVIGMARDQLDGDDSVVETLWDDLSRLDFTALPVPLEQGGMGEDLRYTALVLEEAGRVAMPGPFPETVAFAVPLVTALGSADQRERYLPAVADGDLRMSFALYESLEGRLPGDIQLTAERDGDGFRLSGTKTYVPYLEAVDSVLVAARTQQGQGYEGVTAFVVDTDQVTGRRLDALDRTRPLYEVSFDALEVPRDAQLGPLHGAGPALTHAMDAYQVAACSMLVGGADRVVDLSVEHATEREQYGHPIGRYQAVKHRIADMWMDVELARSLVYYAAWALATDAPDARRAVSAAKAFCVEEFAGLYRDDIQNQGAMGATWDHDAHIYLKQAKGWQNFLGSPRDHRERILEARGV